MSLRIITKSFLRKHAGQGSLFQNDQITEDGKIPASVHLNVSGPTLIWASAWEKDIINYRVYSSEPVKIKVASITSRNNLSFAASSGVYFVTAVDINGNESAPSNHVVIEKNP